MQVQSLLFQIQPVIKLIRHTSDNIHVVTVMTLHSNWTLRLNGSHKLQKKGKVMLYLSPYQMPMCRPPVFDSSGELFSKSCKFLTLPCLPSPQRARFGTFDRWEALQHTKDLKFKCLTSKVSKCVYRIMSFNRSVYLKKTFHPKAFTLKLFLIL